MIGYVFSGSLGDANRLAVRFAAISFVESLQIIGFTRSAAVASAAAHFELHPGTIWKWLGWVSGTARGDQQLRLRLLSNHDAQWWRPVEETPDAR